MATKWIFPFLFLITNDCFAQVAAIAMDKFNIAYLGLPNPITVAVENRPCKSIFLTTDNGRINKYDDCRFEYLPDSIGKTMIHVKTIKRGDTITIGGCEVRVKNIPNPIAKVAGRTIGSVQKHVLRPQQGIYAAYEGLDLDAKVSVQSFTMFAAINGKLTILKSESALFTDEMKLAFQQIDSDDIIVFKDIMAKISNGRIIPLNPVILTIE